MLVRKFSKEKPLGKPWLLQDVNVEMRFGKRNVKVSRGLNWLRNKEE
jgi:hypothetical protein